MVLHAPVVAAPLSQISQPRYRRAVFAWALGALAACGFQPLHLWVLTLLGVGGLAWLVMRAETRREAAWLGWLWGWGHFTVALNWIATAFTYQAKMPAALGWIAVVGLSAYLALYPALATAAAWGLRRAGAAFAPGLAAAWIVGEWLRGWVFTGFPWDPLGVALLGGFAHPGLAGLAPWLGTYALSGLMVLLAAGVVVQTGVVARGLAAVAVVAAHVLAGWISPAPTPASALPVTVVQPGIAQSELDDPALFEAHDTRILRLSLPLVPGRRRLVLWPEAGLADYLRDGYPAWVYAETTWAGDPQAMRARIAMALGRNALLLTGAVDPVMASPLRIGAVRNVVTALDDHGRIVGGYAKAHLVPYGEYLPMRVWLGPLGLARLVPGDIDYLPGPGPRTLDLGVYGKAGVQICYEIVFPGAVVDAAHRPDYIMNPTSDGWFGSWGPPQHLAQARLRAIEEGLPVLRPTTSGISAVIDPRGVVLQSIPRGPAGRIDLAVPQALPPTAFARLGNLLSLGWAALLVAVALVMARRRGRARLPKK